MIEKEIMKELVLNDMFINPRFSEEKLSFCFSKKLIEIYPKVFLLSNYDFIKLIMKNAHFTSYQIGEGNYAKLFEILSLARLELSGDVLFSDNAQHTKLREILVRAYINMQDKLPLAVDKIVSEYFQEFTDRHLSLIHLSTYISEKLFLGFSGVGEFSDYPSFNAFFTSIRLLLNGIDNNFSVEEGETLAEHWKSVFYIILEKIDKIEDSFPSLISCLTDVQSLTKEEKAIMTLAFIRAGIENPRSFIVSAILRYFEKPQLYIDNSLQFLDEVLRYDCPAKITARYVNEDTEIQGVLFKKNTKLWLSFRLANFNPTVFNDPFTFKLRKPNPNLSLGFGPHFCIGKELTYLLTKKIIDSVIEMNYSIDEYDKEYTLDTSLVFRRYVAPLYIRKVA